MSTKSEYGFWQDYPYFVNNTGGPHSRPLHLYLIAKREYYRGKPVMSDHTFDAFEVAIKEAFPDCPALEVVGEPSQEDVNKLSKWLVETRKVYNDR